METEHGSVKHRGKHRALLQHGPPPPPPPLDTSPLLWSTAAHHLPDPPLPVSTHQGQEGRSLKRMQIQCEMGLEKHHGAQLRSVSTSLSQNGVTLPQI